VAQALHEEFKDAVDRLTRARRATQDRPRIGAATTASGNQQLIPAKAGSANRQVRRRQLQLVTTSDA
jgi:hypothetical protein